MNRLSCGFPLVCVAAFCLPGFCADSQVKVGGIDLTLPPPTAEFMEVGSRIRANLFELTTPAQNRLLTAYVPGRTLSEMMRDSPPVMKLWGMVQINRSWESLDASRLDFDRLVKNMVPNDAELSAGAEGVQRLNRKIRARGMNPVEVDKPEFLGMAFRKPDAAATLVLGASRNGIETIPIVAGSADVRVRSRVLYVYLYSRFESEESVNWVRRNLEVWCDVILSRNR